MGADHTEEVHPMDRCSLCGEPIRYWHDHLVERDDIIETKWHQRCAKDYKEWLYKITHILPSYQDEESQSQSQLQIPRNYRWDRYFENYHRKILFNLNDNRKKE